MALNVDDHIKQVSNLLVHCWIGKRAGRLVAIFGLLAWSKIPGISVTGATPKVLALVSRCGCFIDLFSHGASSNKSHHTIDNAAYGAVNPTVSATVTRINSFESTRILLQDGIMALQRNNNT